MTFSQFRINRFEITDAVFMQNKAQTGGAIYAEYYVYSQNRGDIRLFFQDFNIQPHIQLNNTILMDNSALGGGGGALLLTSIRALLTNVTMSNNTAAESGGACAFNAGSVVLLINGTFRKNKAATGGAIALGERSMLHCIKCEMTRNVASNDGGGLMAVILMPQQFGFQCDTCSITQNRARLGG